MRSLRSFHPSLLVPFLGLIVACTGTGESARAPATATPPAPGTSTPAVASPSGRGPGTNLVSGCVEDFQPGVDYFPEEVEFQHATGVEVSYHDTYKVVTVTQPWAGADREFTYVLRQCGTPADLVGDDLADATAIEVPVERVVTMSTTHLPAFDLLGVTDRLVGVGSTAYVYTESVREAAAAGEIVETGTNAEADLERLLSIDPDLVMTYSFGDLSGESIDQMTAAGLPVVLNGDYTEPTPLGRAEWLKFAALFLNAEARAAELFTEIAGDYQQLTERVAGTDERPSVLLSTPFQGTWYVPRGDSAAAEQLADAGASYVFAGRSGEAAGTGNLALDIEAVLAAAVDADYWLNVGTTAASLEQMAAIDERFREFEAFQEGHVYAETKRTSPAGGIDFYETGYARPDLVLADLVAILHPALLPDHELVFYERLPATAPAPSPAPASSPSASEPES